MTDHKPASDNNVYINYHIYDKPAEHVHDWQPSDHPIHTAGGYYYCDSCDSYRTALERSDPS